jgi:bacterioferritin
MYATAQTNLPSAPSVTVARRTTIPTVRSLVDINRRRGSPADPVRMPTGYSANRAVLEAMLNEVLATELVCVLRYRRYFFITKPSQADGVKPTFLRYAHLQQEQADRIAERIVQLGASAQVDPSDLAARSRSRSTSGTDLQDMVGEDLLFVRTAIETYGDMVRYFKTHDLTTARMLASILAIHEQHAEELTALMIDLTPPLRG